MNVFATAPVGGNFAVWQLGEVAIGDAIVGFEDIVLIVWFWNGAAWLSFAPGVPLAFNADFTMITGSVLWLVGV